MVLLIGLLCVPLFLYLLPNLEQSRNEARIAQTYHEVWRLSRLSHDKVVRTQNVHSDNNDVDPWGQPYKWIAVGDDSVRVVSSGPNMKFAESGVDEDGIYSDMPDSPALAMRTEKDHQLLLAFVVALGVWLSFSVLYWQSRRRFLD